MRSACFSFTGAMGRLNRAKRAFSVSTYAGVAVERPAEGGGRRLPGEVVLGGAEPAARDHDVRPGEGVAERRLQEAGVVRDRDPGPRLHSHLEQPPRHPERVRVGAERAEELAADGQELRPQRARHVTAQTVRPARSSRFA